MGMKKELIPLIESNLNKMTTTEKEIAAYFLERRSVDDVTTSFFCEQLHVSKASLTRFSKKCGFNGFREFLYRYRDTMLEQNYMSAYKDRTQNVLSDYEEMLRKHYSVLDESQLERIQKLIETSSRIYFYAKGSSALAMKEMKMRFMRLGIMGEVIDDSDMILWNSMIVDNKCVVIGASISGKTKSIINALGTAKRNGAKTVLLTTRNLENHGFCDEVLLLASTQNLAYGNRISPQFPILLMTDCLFSYFLDNKERRSYYDRTIINKEN
ncbi:UNVERIFIED_CONTAM: MurR/RpiR family transcriptional regulator [Streptococcus canis]|uniref:MurR/RpiR family transcriptional regulator n=5 Tax=Streptococcus canis TaxID=1329 RepID=A0AAE4TSY2_STRCB|nr:MurR/RpiR family transcriptional regulator [Streptococcus canis]EIQ82745.1 transcriptional regulator, RpiR family protein [Streptococcus canis FSL Z3-227]MDV5972230.1 MurR/RpiR family transcriptional regulator [Streptococcus canis]MDV5977447.1 MurR/RpiR family transcriptional regulator [Streptococcus canis]MDV5993868.1 MurR/RpiR family transcriptional regulator [Streptococcus canis]MDV6000798.1 MurR/RpiR family transcriptional regulator [Streptococcus canis]